LEREGNPAQTTIVAMMPNRVPMVIGQQPEQFFDQSKETMKLRAIISDICRPITAGDSLMKFSIFC
jgi:hypothetical protein